MAMLADYVNIINGMNYLNQSETISRSVWFNFFYDLQKEEYVKYIDKFFTVNGTIQNEIEISRNDLYTLGQNVQNNINNNDNLVYEFIIKVLMWGYPKMYNLRRHLQQYNYIEDIANFLINYNNCPNQFSYYYLIGCFCSTARIGVSTYSKILHFYKVKNCSDNFCQILDSKIINVINNQYFDDTLELTERGEYNDSNKDSRYPEYVNWIHKTAKKLDVQVENLELYLFRFSIDNN